MLDTVDQCDMKMSVVNISNMKKTNAKKKKWIRYGYGHIQINLGLI